MKSLSPLLFSFFVFPFISFAQNNNNRAVANEGDSIPEDVRIITKKRALTDSFFHDMLFLAEPSTISGKYVDYTFNSNSAVQKKSYILNADIQVPIGLGGERWAIGNWMSTVQAIPEFKVRIFDNDSSQGDSSLPVRTPSYLPHITYYGTSQCLWNAEKNRYYYCGLSFFHHSNGQDHHETDTLGNINRYNGNFSENLAIEFIIGGRKKIGPRENLNYAADLDTGNYRNGRMKTQAHPSYANEFYWKLGYEWHPYILSTTYFRERKMYGRYRFNLLLGYTWAPVFQDFVYSAAEKKWYAVSEPSTKEMFRFLLNINFIADTKYFTGNEFHLVKPTVSQRFNIYGTIHWRIPGTPYASLFLQGGHWGSDNYNIYFQESLWQFRFGIGFGFFKYGKK